MIMSTPNPISLLSREPNAVYRAQAQHYLSSHALADFRRCPLLYHQKRTGLIEDEDRPAYVVGRALHVLALEGKERFYEEFTVGGPINPKTGSTYGSSTKAFAEWAEAQGCDVLSDGQFDLVSRMAQSVDSHKRAQALMSVVIAEGVVRTPYCSMECQGRIDWFTGREIVDLKTVDVLDFFPQDARRFGYHHQMAFYRALIQQRCGVALPCYLIAVEKKAPFRTGVWRILDHVLSDAEAQNAAAIERLAHCQRLDSWPTLFEDELIFDLA